MCILKKILNVHHLYLSLLLIRLSDQRENIAYLCNDTYSAIIIVCCPTDIIMLFYTKPF